MCPSAAASSDAPAVPTTTGEAPSNFQAVDAHAPSAPEVAERRQQATNGQAAAAGIEIKNPYSSRYADFLSNTSNWKIIESTLRGQYAIPELQAVAHSDDADRRSSLNRVNAANPSLNYSDLLEYTIRRDQRPDSLLRTPSFRVPTEGEQFANAFFDTETKMKIAQALSDFGVEYIEITSPAASEQSRADCVKICQMGLKSKILTHIRCHMDDARIAVETGVDGVDVVIGTSSFLRKYSHGKDITYIIKSAIEVIEFVKSKGIEVRFSSEDSFRSDLVDLLSIYRAVDKIGVNRVGIADTVGCANPRQVYDLVRTLRGVVSCDIECHFHDDSGCAVANAFCALEAGATHIDTSVLGIGERNGITTLGGLIARMYVVDPEYVKSKYNLPMLREVENLVADAVQISVPFNNPITGFCAFTHKAGIHAKAILANPSTYEILKPEDFGMSRYIDIGSRLTGWNAVKSRVEQLGLVLSDDQVKDVTAKIKELADVRTQSMDDVDTVLRVYHGGVTSGALKLRQPQVFDELLAEHKSEVPSNAEDTPAPNKVAANGY